MAQRPLPLTDYTDRGTDVDFQEGMWYNYTILCGGDIAGGERQGAKHDEYKTVKKHCGRGGGYKLALVLGIALAGISVQAETNIWIGASTGGDWSTVSNWSRNEVPASDDIVVFDKAVEIAPPSTFAGCMRNIGSGCLTVSVASDMRFSLALGTYGFASTGASFRKTGQGTLTLQAWPGINPGTVTVAEGAVNFAGNGSEAPGAFDRIVVESGASAAVVESPAATRHGYAYRVGKPNMTYKDGWTDDYGKLHNTGDVPELVRRWEDWVFVHSIDTYDRFQGIKVVDDEALAFDRNGYPAEAHAAVFAYGDSNQKSAIYYYRGIFICDATQQTFTFTLKQCNSSFFRFAISDTTPFGTNGRPSSAPWSFQRTPSRGWATLTMGLQADLRFGNTPLWFNLSSSAFGALTGKRLWNGVCANALEIASGATFTIGDGQALAVANARALKNAGTFASATDDAVLFLASDWDTGDAKLNESSISGFTGTLEYGAGAMDKTLVALSDGDTFDLPREHLPALAEKTSLQPVSDATWQRTGNTAYTNGNTAIVIFDWARKAESNGARAAIIAKEGIPVYCAFEMSCDFYMAENPGYKQKDTDFGLFVQSQGPTLTYYNSWTSRSAYMLPRYKQAFGAFVGTYYKKLYWVTNTVASVGDPNNDGAKFIGSEMADQGWTRPAANTPMKWTLSYDGHGTFTASVQTNANGEVTTTTHTYPQLTDAKYADTTFYPSILGRFKTDGFEIKTVIVSNIVLKVHSGTAPAWPIEVEAGASATVRGATVADDGVPPYEMDGSMLRAGASVSVEPYGDTTGIKWTDLKVAGPSSIAAASGVTNVIRSLVYTGSMQASTLTLSGTVAFASPLVITVPAEWMPLGKGAVLVDYSAATCVAPPDVSRISIITSAGDDETGHTSISTSGGLLRIAGRGFVIIFR